MQKNQRVADMAIDVLARQAGERAQRTGEPFEEALKTVLDTEAGRQLGELRDGPHRDERAKEWQENLVRDRARERKREQPRREAGCSKPPLGSGSCRQSCGSCSYGRADSLQGCWVDRC